MTQQELAEAAAKQNDSPEVLALFNEALPLVDIIAHQLRKTLSADVELDELRSAGREGLWQAAQRFDPEQGVKFRSFADLRVRGAMIDEVRRLFSERHKRKRSFERLAEKHLRACETARALDEGQIEYAAADVALLMSPADAEAALDAHLCAVTTAAAMVLSQSGTPAVPMRGEDREILDAEGALLEVPDGTLADHEARHEQSELLGVVWNLLGDLDPPEAEIIRRHYFQGQELAEISRALCTDKSWVSRLHTRAITKLSVKIVGRVGASPGLNPG